MNQSCFISPTSAAAIRQVTARDVNVEPKKKGGARAADAVYTYAPTQPLPRDYRDAGGKRNTHGVRTNG